MSGGLAVSVGRVSDLFIEVVFGVRHYVAQPTLVLFTLDETTS